jgi:hypothetical protein
MAINVFPAPSTSSVTAQAVSITTANVPKQIVQTFAAGVYQISVSPSSSTAIVQFTSGSTWIGQTTTSSGTINYNLATAADTIYVQSNNAGDVVTVNLTASVPVTPAISGTLDTITTSGTYNQTGKLWVLAIGGGGGGGGSRTNYGNGGSGGCSGAMAMYYGNVSGSTTVTIGAGGTAGPINTGAGAGGTTSFGTYAVAIGGNGGSDPSGQVGATATGTSSGTVVIPSADGYEQPNPFRGIKNGTTGAGGQGRGGGGNGNPTNGYGSGIGSGGNSVVSTAGGNATGYGAGGGGGSGNGGNISTPGGAGAPGVVYVLRGF